jgi:folate-binding Fe-S cluster repair protein YgfZ
LLKDDEDSVVAICSQCNMVQLIKDKEYEVSANITIKTIPESEKILLKICTENIRKLIPNIDASYSKQKLEEEILQTPTVKLVYIIKNGYVEDIHFI